MSPLSKTSLYLLFIFSLGIHASVLALGFPQQEKEQRKPERIKLQALTLHAVKEVSPTKKKIETKSKALTPPKKQPVAKKRIVKKPAPIAKKVEAPTPPQPVEVAPEAPQVSPELVANYERQLVAWLQRFKKYPRIARRRGLEGTTHVQITISRSGVVLAKRISTPAKHSFFDTAAIDMVTRANPFPPMPENYPGTELNFVVPIDFQLR